MKRIKKLFIEFKQTTPKHIQWLLLVAAFIVVIILLTLLLGKHFTNKEDKTVPKEEKPIEWSFNPAELSFIDTVVGETNTKTVTLNVSDTVFIDDIQILDENNDDWTYNDNCQGKPKDNTCNISIIYEPHAEHSETKTSLVIKYHLPDKDDTKQQELPVMFSAKELPQQKLNTEIEPKQPDTEKTEPSNTSNTNEILESDDTQESKDVLEPNDDLEPKDKSEPEDFQDKATKEISVIAPENPFKNIQYDEPEPNINLPSKSCSDFAIPGYNQSGVQIGWIRPDSGANYFHPFSDKDCSNPTGKYDWITGVITSLKDGSKIGTDADHIGYRNVKNRGLTLDSLGLSPAPKKPLSLTKGTFGEEAKWIELDQNEDSKQHVMQLYSTANADKFFSPSKKDTYLGSAEKDERVISSQPYDRTFILRQFKPIPATIVSEVRADASVYGCNGLTEGNKCSDKKNYSIPVRATVDRNVFSDDGRTIIIPTGTLLMGYLSGDLPGPYQSFGRMNVKWYQFIRPDGVEFNFPEEGDDPYSGDAQGRVGVPGRGSTDYVEQMVIPILTAIVPAAVNMIAPIADSFVNQINLDNNTVVQSGTIRSSEMAKQEIINQWNRITNKLVVDAISNTVPPFSIPAGTRINVYSPVDLIVNCPDLKGKKCNFVSEEELKPSKRRKWKDLKGKVTVDKSDSSWIGQVRSWDLDKFCEYNKEANKWTINGNWAENEYGYDYRTVLLYCESKNYVAKNLAKNAVYSQNVEENAEKKYGNVTYDQNKYGMTVTQNADDPEKVKAYNEEVLGLQYNEEDGTIMNPFAKAPEEVLTCDDGTLPDANGCCTGETYTDMSDQGLGFNCCPESGDECFPPIVVE